jgi:hypothetical protein
MDWFQTVSRIGKRAADDHAHGVIQIAALHFFFYVDWDSVCCFGHSITHPRFDLVLRFNANSFASRAKQNAQWQPEDWKPGCHWLLVSVVLPSR